jgi:hypothetical protein
MIKKLFTYFAVLTAFVFCGCASLPEPSLKEKTLLIGNINFQYENWENVNFEKNKKLYQNIELTICNSSTLRNYTMQTSSDGSFSRTGLPAGTYYLVKLDVKFTDIGSEAEHWITFGTEKYSFQIRNGVTNLGRLEWTSDYKTNTYTIKWNKDYSIVHTKFVYRHSDSAWVYAGWTDAVISRE